MQRVINFSGGETSAYMTIKHYREGDIVLFCDTRRERPKTYKFINDFEAFEGIPVKRLSYLGGFENLLEKRQAVPNRFKRFCTIELKVKTARRYLRGLGLMKYENLIGFRVDEQQRIKANRNHWQQVVNKFPLNEDGITKQMISEYWKHKPYQLEVPKILGNCTLCFQKGKDAIMAILASYPELADVWIADEEKHGHTYLTDISMRQMRSIAQNNLFKDYDLNDIAPAFNCACTS